MSSKKTTPSKKNHNKSTSRSKSRPKNNKKEIGQCKNNVGKFENKKKCTNLVKKKIEDLKAPQLIIKAFYKNKKLSILIGNSEEQGLNDIMQPHISRFQKEILRNMSFDAKDIECWRTVSPGDPLKDYYFQSGKSLQVFKGQVLQIEPVWKNQKKDPVTLQDFQFIRCLGLGGFSRVYAAKYRPTGKFYALKLMDKEKLLKSGKQCIVENERDIMIELDSPYVQKLYFGFETQFFMVLGLEYCPGGQLFYYLKKVGKMNQQEARYCFMEILLGIQYLHEKNIIYRDIKPENILIDQDGHLKIADFGLSRVHPRPDQLSYTYCGSAEYMAPEMLNREGHTFSVDYYCLGALLYEIVTGFPPFYCNDPAKIAQSIKYQDVTFPSHVQLTHQIQMLIEGLLKKDPNQRLGCLGGIKEILAHPWMRKIKVSDVVERKIATPIKVDILTYNISEDQIAEMDGSFDTKLKEQKLDFQRYFEQFYYNRYDAISVINQAYNTTKTDSTKENKSQNLKNHKNLRQKQKQGKKSGYRSQNRENIKFPIKIKNDASACKGLSELRNLKGKIMAQHTGSRKNILHRQQSKDKKKRQKVLSRKNTEKKMRNKSQDRIMSPLNQRKGLKRIQSSATLRVKSKDK